MAGGVLAVLGTDSVARHVAGLMGLRVVEPNDALIGRVLVVVHRSESIDAVARLVQSVDVAGLIAWSLPEAATLRCYELGPPVVVGQPDPDELRALAWLGAADEPSAADRALTERLAHLEAAF
ncbi:MAG: hypothetical protein ACOYNI_10390 [Acidimicrobiia bacterium]